MLQILIVGVGGQGTLFASRVLGDYAIAKGLDCKLSEVHGMAQRGGSVVTHVKIGDKVFSPIIGEGNADAIIACEELEGLRMAHFLKKGGVMLVNTQRISPLPVITGAAQYPVDAVERLKKLDAVTVAVDALSLACESGSAKTVNTVMLGAATKILGLDEAAVVSALEKRAPAAAKLANSKAFSAGLKAAAL